jgi:hypothetical protein
MDEHPIGKRLQTGSGFRNNVPQHHEATSISSSLPAPAAAEIMRADRPLQFLAQKFASSA